MKKFQERWRSKTPSAPLSLPSGNAIPIPNVGVTICRSNRQVRIQDRDRVFDDILMQGEEMNQFLDELKEASRVMPNAPIKDALVVVTAPYVANNWKHSC